MQVVNHDQEEEAMREADLRKLKHYLSNNVSRDSGEIKKFFKEAIKSKNVIAIQCLLENGVSINLPLNNTQLSPLHFAVQNLYLDIVELLLEHQADVNTVNSHGLTTLHFAAGVSGILWEVLRTSFPRPARAVDVLRAEVTDVQERSLKIMQLLLDRGCNVNARDNSGCTPLYNIFYDATKRYISGSICSVWHTEEVAEIRRNKSKSIDQIRAIQSQKLKLLLDRGADVGVRFGGSQDTIIHVLLRDLQDSRNFQQFVDPCFVDEFHEEMMKQILNQNVIDVNFQNNKGETPIKMALSILSAGIVRLLVDHGADLNSVRINHFFYPKAPPCLEAVENLLDIIALRHDKELPLSPDETLAVLEFFIPASFSVNGRISFGSGFEDKFREFLEFGTEDVIIKMLEEIIEKITGYSDYVVFFTAYEGNVYLSKMTACGLSVNQKIEAYLKNLISRVYRRILLTDQVFLYLDQINEEGPKVKSLQMPNNKPLLDILNLPFNEIYSFTKNYQYKEIIRTNFFVIPGIINGFFARCLIRRFVLEIANDNIRFVSAAALPDSCCEKISKYLKNWDLLNLFKATMLPQPEVVMPIDRLAQIAIS